MIWSPRRPESQVTSPGPVMDPKQEGSGDSWDAGLEIQRHLPALELLPKLNRKWSLQLNLAVPGGNLSHGAAHLWNKRPKWELCCDSQVPKWLLYSGWLVWFTMCECECVSERRQVSEDWKWGYLAPTAMGALLQYPDRMHRMSCWLAIYTYIIYTSLFRLLEISLM